MTAGGELGALREYVEIQSSKETADTEGQPVKNWNTISDAFVRAVFLSGRELEAMQKINAQTTVRFRTHYRDDLALLTGKQLQTMRILFRDVAWNIHAVLPDEDTLFMWLLSSRVN